MEVVQEGYTHCLETLPAANSSWLSEEGVKSSYLYQAGLTEAALCNMEHLYNWHCLWMCCMLCRWSPKLKHPPLRLRAHLHFAHLQKQPAVLDAQPALSFKHPGAAGPWGLRRRENEWQGRGGTEIKTHPFCIAEFGFPTTRPRCKKKDSASLAQLPLFSWPPDVRTEQKTECSSWEKERRPKWQGGEVQRDLEGLIARPGHPWGRDDPRASFGKLPFHSPGIYSHHWGCWTEIDLFGEKGGKREVPPVPVGIV